MNKECAIRHLTMTLAPMGVHDLAELVERVLLVRGPPDRTIHSAILYWDAVRACREPTLGGDGLGLTWRVSRPMDQASTRVDFHCKGALAHLQLPGTGPRKPSHKELQASFLGDDLHGPDADLVRRYVMEQMTGDDRTLFWADLADACAEVKRWHEDANQIRRMCNANHLLRTAAKSGEIEAVSAALSLGADPNSPDLLGHTAIHFAVGDGHRHLIKPLIEAGADINTRGGGAGSTPLHMAARSGDAKTCLLLMAHGADANLKDDLGRTPIELALRELAHEHEQAPAV